MKEAMFYEKLAEEAVQCKLCPHYCTLKTGERGKCGVRENKHGKLYTMCYGKAVSAGVDPIEKKPLYHFKPGSYSMSVATVGCNFACRFCQNFSISQGFGNKRELPGDELPPGRIVELAIQNECESISYTYTEPTIFYEYAYDTARMAKEKGIANVFVTNGFINPEPQKEIVKYLDAVNVDLKSFSDDFYKETVGGRLQPVLDAIRAYHEAGVWVEVTTLVIPGKNDQDLEKIADFIASVDVRIPWHISRFFPMYKLDHLEPTPPEMILKAVELGRRKGLKYVYAGNLRGKDLQSTYCPKCGEPVISRDGGVVDNTKDGRCRHCSARIDMVR